LFCVHEGKNKINLMKGISKPNNYKEYYDFNENDFNNKNYSKFDMLRKKTFTEKINIKVKESKKMEIEEDEIELKSEKKVESKKIEIEKDEIEEIEETKEEKIQENKIEINEKSINEEINEKKIEINEEMKSNKNQIEINEEKEDSEIKIEDSNEGKKMKEEKNEINFEKKKMKRSRISDKLVIKAPEKKIDYIREYSHLKLKSSTTRKDFMETIFWSADTCVDESTTIEFQLPDSITSFRISIDGFNEDGLIGFSTKKLIKSTEPFYIEPKLPLEITSGDTLIIPVNVVNSTDNKFDSTLTFSLKEKYFKVLNQFDEKIKVKPDSRSRYLLELKSLIGNKKTSISFNADSELFSDNTKKEINVISEGFPTHINVGDLLKKGDEYVIKFNIPENRIADSQENTKFTFFPSSLSDLNNSIKSLIKEPSGCFEQMCSTIFPLVFAYEFFKKDKKSIMQKIENGYNKLKNYQNSSIFFS
jgi:hypothetical protein